MICHVNHSITLYNATAKKKDLELPEEKQQLMKFVLDEVMSERLLQCKTFTPCNTGCGW
jgi:hypothetical protein